MTIDNPSSVTTKLLLPTIIISVLTVMAIVITFAYFEQLEIERQAELNAEFVIESLVIGTEADASSGNVQRILAALAANKNIHRLTLIGSENIIIADNDQMRIGEVATETMNDSEKLILGQLTRDKSIKHADIKRGHLFYRAFRIALIDPIVNRLRLNVILLVYDEISILEKVQRELLGVLLIITTGIFVMISAMYFVLRRVLLIPLRNISSTLEAQDDSLEKLISYSSSNDEIGMLVDSYNVLVTRRDEQEKALLEARRYIDSITEEVPVLLAYVGRDKRYRFVNKNYERWYGKKASDFLGSKFDEFLLEEASEIVRGYADRVLGGEHVDYDFEYAYPIVGLRQVHITYSPDRDSIGIVKGFFICIEDVTDRVSSERKITDYANKLEVEKNNAQSASVAKSEFLANISHELRTPLNSLLILSTSLAENAEGNLTASQIESARFIHDGGEELLELINDLLDLSKAEAGMLSIFKEDILIEHICRSMRDRMAPISDQQQIPFVIEVEADVPSMMHNDMQRINQILKNFLSNAFKFTKQGEIKLRIYTVESKEDMPETILDRNRSVVFAVIDSGIGIATDKQASIFEAFQQEDGSTSRHYGGTGLGLTIAHKLAGLIGGQITLSSRKGVGSTFSLYLPVGEVVDDHGDQSTCSAYSALYHKEESSLLKSKIDTVSDDHLADIKITQTKIKAFTANKEIDLFGDKLQGKKALLVDDDMRNVFALSMELSNVGMEVTIADNGRMAVEKAESNVYDIVLMDIMMPEMDGYEATKRIRKLAGMADIPIVALTAKAMADDEEKCLAAGASGYMKKPVKIDELIVMIQGCLDQTYSGT